MQIRYEINSRLFARIPGSPIAYWGSLSIFAAFTNKPLSMFVDCKSGIMAGNEKFIVHWHEPSFQTIKFNCSSYKDMGTYRWFPLNSGGDFRKWFGNLDKVIDLWNDGENIKNNSKNFRLRDKNLYFKPGITWGRISSSKIAFRSVKEGTLFGDAGPVGFIDQDKPYILSFLASKVAGTLLEFINPTLNYQVGDIMRLPLAPSHDKKAIVAKICEENISASARDWDSFETSWDFKKHPLV